jgi:GDP-L-fucose synthase
MKRILVTGGRGLVGSAINREIENDRRQEEEWTFVDSRDGDLRKEQDTRIIIEGVLKKCGKEDEIIVIHLASRVGGVFENKKYNADFYMDNSRMNENIIRICNENNIKRVISCLSTCIFPDKNIVYPIEYSMLHNGAPHSSNYGYAYSKRNLDIMNKLYNEQYNCNYMSVIPTNIYGISDNFEIESSHVIPGLIHKCIIAKETNKEWIIMGNGSAERQFINVNDVAKLIIRISREYKSNESIILSVPPESSVSIREIVDIIVECVGFKGKYRYSGNKEENGQDKKTVSNKTLIDTFGDYKFVSLKDGIKETVEWFILNYKNARK